jgi:hypothetical protein
VGVLHRMPFFNLMEVEDMWFKNKETGIQWDVTDEELIKRLEKNDANYEIVELEKTEVIESPQTVITKNVKIPEKEQVK